MERVKHLRLRMYVLQPVGFQTVLGGDPLIWVQFEHLIQQIQGRHGHEHEIVPQPSAAMFLCLKRMEQWQLNNARPHGRCGCATQSRYHVQLGHFCVGLKQRFLPEQFAQNATAAPHINGGTVTLFAQQQFWRPIPQRNHFVGVRSLTVFGIVEAGETKIGEFHFAPVKKKVSLKSKIHL